MKLQIIKKKYMTGDRFYHIHKEDATGKMVYVSGTTVEINVGFEEYALKKANEIFDALIAGEEIVDRKVIREEEIPGSKPSKVNKEA